MTGFKTVSHLPYDSSCSVCISNDEKRMLAWEKVYPDFLGYNCRITAYTILKRNIKVKKYTDLNGTFLSFDQSALENAPVTHFTRSQQKAFNTLFNTVTTPVTKNRRYLYSLAKRQWKDAGVSFTGSAELITVRTHSNIERGTSELNVGHAGVLIPDGTGYLFIEKLSFDCPYQVLKFNSKEELTNYLLLMYSDYTDSLSAKPFIMDNYSRM